MILIHIITEDEKQVHEVSELLIKERLIVSAVITQNVLVKKRSATKAIISTNQFLMIGKTKALLFNVIDKKLRELFKNNMPVLYSVPIVQMDWEQADQLVEETTKI